MAESTLQSVLGYTAKGESPEPRQELCSKCLAISWNPEDFKHLRDEDLHIGLSFSHHKTFGELETSCETGCRLCQTFFLLLVYTSAEFKSSDPLLWKLEGGDDGWSLHCTSSGLPDERAMWFMRDDSWCPPSQAITAVKGLTPASFENDLKVIVDESINPWIEACARSGKHKNCPRFPPTESDSHRMPTRLIDVGSSGDPAVRLVNTADLSGGDKVSPYIILSYCWGSGNDPARTTSRNLRGRLVSIQLKSLPKTIQDAIRVTRLMKMQYLWVDAVCIIQADKTLGAQQQDDVARADWQRESTHMGSYYMNSLCCIAASNAKDSSEGFLTERRVARYGYRKWLAPPNLFLPSPYCIREQSRSLLFDRGWCLQEWILSPRILHWTANGLVWECSHGFFWEGQTGFQEKDPEVFGDAPGDDDARQTDDCLLDFGVNAGGKASQILHSGEKEALGEAWTELVSQYSQMHLTVPSDRLAAIQGIASQLSNRHGVEYFAGVFRSRCADHLMWRTEDYETSTGVNGDFPSWSWANSRRGISFGTISHEDWGSFMEDLEPFPSAQDEESLTRIANKELC
ncbi:hypothetical protein LB503_007127, partial [Fusarium chuoi]